MLNEVAEVAEHWKESPPMADCVRAYLGVKPAPAEEPDELQDGPPRELTEEEYRRMVERDKAWAAKNGGPRNPFA